MTLDFPYKCLICKLRFDAEENCKNCPRCGSRYTQKLLRKDKKRVEKKIHVSRLSGNHVKIGGKKCRGCRYSERTVNLVIKCTCNDPTTTYRQNIGWICFSYTSS